MELYPNQNQMSDLAIIWGFLSALIHILFHPMRRANYALFSRYPKGQR